LRELAGGSRGRDSDNARDLLDDPTTHRASGVGRC
jgi:hypothetical protein